MKIVDKYEDNGALFYTVELEDDVFVDVKCDIDLCYVMDCEDGYKVYNSDGNTFDYHYNADEVIEFVKQHRHTKMSKLKARICTTLLVIAITVVLTASFFVKGYYGINLYQILIGSIGYMWIGEHIEKFYKWLIK